MKRIRLSEVSLVGLCLSMASYGIGIIAFVVALKCESGADRIAGVVLRKAISAGFWFGALGFVSSTIGLCMKSQRDRRCVIAFALNAVCAAIALGVFVIAAKLIVVG